MPTDTVPSPETRRAARNLVLGWIRMLWRGAGWIYLAGLAGLWIAYHLVGETWPLLAVLLFAPQQIFLLPFAVLLPVALLVDRRFALIHAAALAISVWLFLGPQWVGGAAPKADSIQVITYNRGQHAGQSMRPFVERHDPDLILLQDAKRRALNYRSTYPAYPFASDHDEFVVLSRFPVGPGERVEATGPSGRSTLIAARFVVGTGDNQFALYNVHFPTPRDALQGAGLRTLVLSAIPGAPGSRGDAGRQLRAFWKDRIAMARELNRRLRTDPLPALAGGDFNTPGLGKCHRLLTAGLRDTHLVRGSGFGYTFPGISRNPLTLFGPWLRLDRVLVTKRWKVDAAITEPDRPSQHRAFYASVRLPGTPRSSLGPATPPPDAPPGAR